MRFPPPLLVIRAAGPGWVIASRQRNNIECGELPNKTVMREAKGAAENIGSAECADTELRRQPGAGGLLTDHGPGATAIRPGHSGHSRLAAGQGRIPDTERAEAFRPGSALEAPRQSSRGLFPLIAYNDRRHLTDLVFLLNHFALPGEREERGPQDEPRGDHQDQPGDDDADERPALA